VAWWLQQSKQQQQHPTQEPVGFVCVNAPSSNLPPALFLASAATVVVVDMSTCDFHPLQLVHRSAKDVDTKGAHSYRLHSLSLTKAQLKRENIYNWQGGCCKRGISYMSLCTATKVTTKLVLSTPGMAQSQGANKHLPQRVPCKCAFAPPPHTQGDDTAWL
jgi:hypothetical protein